MSEAKCGCSSGCGKCFKWIILILLALNTFFVGSMWCASKCHFKSGKCAINAGGEKICPITGKALSDVKVSDKGSMAQ